MKDDAIEVTAELIDRALHWLRVDHAKVLAKAAELHAAKPQKPFRAEELRMDFTESSPDRRDIDQRMSLVAYAFIRDIRNNNSPADAARLLFGRRHAGPGSGWLGDYLDDLPSVERADESDTANQTNCESSPASQRGIFLHERKGVRMYLRPQFQKKQPHGVTVDLLDRGRAEIYLDMFQLDELKSEADVVKFVDALFNASHGNPDVKALLLEAPFEWLDDAEPLSAKFEKLWAEFQVSPPALDGLHTLREMCLRQPFPWPESMIIALFDEPAFAEAYLDFHNSPD